jgi:aryl-alcohol dehydrogenase-like predicted oxidoreductase
MAIFAYSSLARGLFSGRITRENFQQVQNTIDGTCRHAYCGEVNFQRLDRVQILAKEKGLSIPQIAMAYVLNQPLNVFALVGTASGEELRANVEACTVKLTDRDLAWLDLRSDKR